MQQKTIDNENRVLRFRRSLTQTHRKLELERITQENQRLLKRIQETEPCYNHLEWEESAKAREVYLRNMTEFPDMFDTIRDKDASILKNGTRPVSRSATSLENPSQMPMRRPGTLRPLTSS